MILCDGCRCEVLSTDLAMVNADGHEARYCENCHSHYKQFYAACLATEEMYNRLLDQEIEKIRSRVPLFFVPQDLPRVPRALEGLTLG